MPETLADRIHTFVTAPGSKNLVEAFYAREGTFAGSLFDYLGRNPRDRLTADDLLAVSLLDVPFRPLAVRTLLEQGDKGGALSKMLRALPDDRPLWEASDHDLANARALWEALHRQSVRGPLAGVGPTRRSKLLARKRPHLIPIKDSVIGAALDPLLGTDSWESLREAMREPTLRQEIEDLRPELEADVSVLRLLDTVLWMWCSNSKAARKTRAGRTHPLGWEAT